MIFNPTEHRCAIVVNQNLSNGLAMNAASVIGVSLGNKVNNMVGNDLNSLDNMNYPGVIYAPLPILKSAEQYMKEIEVAAYQKDDIYIIPFSLLAQSCRTYDEYQQKLSEQQYKDIQLAGIGLVGNKKAVTQLIGHLPLFK
ncbi:MULTISPECIES: DUF2000 domain-containing protein [Providencia]|uniref:Uncharacterized protein conserved in bacteria n=1 Tax=Providencia rettgeri TaxID=587 RepID=A0A1B8SVH4_PRORE|nr:MULTISPECIES: DUF2000 domain-containing protein [Providencia]AWS51093.1 DUF2000 domain-containing protein [Providencia rettgeri]EJD6376110.1 DUF2000 domain-containing protein [Providencia rettgeri]EJF7710371.1 DUF2000 domain-containing protein [Providencia rettgeri]EKT57848.1 hypothetical protein OOC_08063 [Providencia rettgeri Dmel1]ELR5117328.1 DUF2000 domain-containing protein [Providencia rettgeri]